MRGASKKLASVISRAPVNIAAIKYWGKRDLELNLPTNDSLSATLYGLDTETEVSAWSDQEKTGHTVFINGEKFPVKAQVWKVINELLPYAKDLRHPDGSLAVSWKCWDQLRLEISSTNVVPTQGGLASSASGYAALTVALNELFQANLDPYALSVIARQGSGSATRSFYDGWVRWRKGSNVLGTDSGAEQVASVDHWPDIRILVLIISHSKKKVPSTQGMIRTFDTVPAIEITAREQTIAHQLEQITKAIQDRDFSTFVETTMRNSNSLHALCLNAYPPIHYLSAASHRVMELVHHLNAQSKVGEIAGYTFDAGPNAVLFVRKDHVPLLLGALRHVFPPSSDSEPAWVEALTSDSGEEGVPVHGFDFGEVFGPAIQRVMVTKVGEGARVIEPVKIYSE